jgi:hypothetical protein
MRDDPSEVSGILFYRSILVRRIQSLKFAVEVENDGEKME